MKTKFIKVPTAERLPKKTGFYFVVKDPSKFDKIQIDRYTVESMEFIGNDILFWLEEVPDREDEMREILSEFIGCANCGHKIPDWLTDKAENLLKNLLNELKQTK